MPGPNNVEPEGSQVFISYCRLDREDAEYLFQSLSHKGIKAWYDASIEPTADWRDTIVNQLGQSMVMVILLSSCSNASEEVKKEFAVAVAAKVPLLAARLEDIKPTGGLAYELSGSNWVNLFDDRNKRFNQLGDFLAKYTRRSSQKNNNTTLATALLQFRKSHPGFVYKVRNILDNASLIGLSFLGVSIVQFLLYELHASPIQQLVDSGYSNLVAILVVLGMVTVGSPLMLLSVFRNGVDLDELPLLATSLLNTLLIMLLIRILYYKLYRKIVSF